MIELDKWGITMTNGEVQNIAHPDSFYIPSEEARFGLQEDAIIKICFDMPEGAERMWVKVVERLDEPGMFIGALDNEPFQSSEFGAGDEFFFHARNVINIWVD